MQTIVLILILAITVEALIQYVKTIIKMLEDKQYKTFATQVAAILIAVFISFAAGVDVYSLVGISFAVSWLGTLLTGIVISRGANYTSDFIKRIQNPDFGEIVLEDVVDTVGWVFFGREKQPGQLEVINDRDGQIVNLFRCIKYHRAALQEELEWLVSAREIFFAAMAQLHTDGLTDIQRAARFFYVLKNSFGNNKKPLQLRAMESDVPLTIWSKFSSG